MSDKGRIPIRAAERLAKDFDCPLVVVFAIHPRPENRFTVTTYGKTRELCKLAADYGEKLAKAIELGEVSPAEEEPEDLPAEGKVWEPPVISRPAYLQWLKEVDLKDSCELWAAWVASREAQRSGA